MFIYMSVCLYLYVYCKYIVISNTIFKEELLFNYIVCAGPGQAHTGQAGPAGIKLLLQKNANLAK